MDTQHMHRLVELRRRRDELENMLAEVKRDETSLALKLAEEFAEDGVQNVNLKPQGATLYVHRSVGANLVIPPEEAGGEHNPAHAALEAAGLGWLIKPTVNPATLTSWFKEQESEGKKIPESLQKYIAVWEEFRVRVRFDGAPNSGA